MALVVLNRVKRNNSPLSPLEFEEKLERYLYNKEAIAQSFGRVLDFFFHTKLDKLLPETLKLPSLHAWLPLFQNLTPLMEKVSTHQKNIYPYQTLGEGIQAKTGESLADFLASLEVEPSAKLVEDLLKQKAFLDIIINIIESGIIEFNKKTNPLFGMIQAAGLDKQIKSFIQIFLPNFIPKIANFLHTTSFGENSTLTKDLVFVALHTDFSELKLPTGEKWEIAKHKWKVLEEQIRNDDTLNNTLTRVAESILDLTKSISTEESLFSLLQISEIEYQKFKETICLHVSEQTVHHAPKEEIKRLLVGIMLDIDSV